MMRVLLSSWVGVPPMLLVAALVGACSDAGPVIDRQDVHERYAWRDNLDRAWYEANIPYIETPDEDLDEIYYYRWEVVNKHLTYGSPETGYLFTEFIDRPFWSGAYGGISCPVGHQLSEVRWLKNPRIIDDFARYWMDTEGALPRGYSNWYGAALWQVYEVWGDDGWMRSMLPYLEEQIDGWYRERFDEEYGLFHWTGHNDGMEVNINSRQTQDEFQVEGYRPTLNSYIYGDLVAASKASALAGQHDKSVGYARRAAELRARVLEELWDEDRTFFFHQWVSDHEPGIRAKTLTHESGPFAGSKFGRELIGYVPWQFHLPAPQHSVAWKFLMDADVFYAPFGPTTAEQRDPLFMISERCCVWSGQSWPYATTQTLAAMANLLNDYEQDIVDAADYWEMLKAYTATHRKDGRPYIAESANPFDGSWSGSDLPNHSEHYLHSGYVDLILGGLLGIRPMAGDSVRINPLVPKDWDYFAVEGVAYHGHDLSIRWDRDGSRFGRGSGFVVLIDRDEVLRLDEIQDVTLPVERRERTLAFERQHNVAANNGRRFPEIRASYSNPETPPFYANDGGIWYHDVPKNRWTAVGSPNLEDWIEVDFGVGQLIAEVALYFVDGIEGISLPVGYSVEILTDGRWSPAPEQHREPARPTGRRANRILLEPIVAEGVRITLLHVENSSSGLAEIEVWTPAGADVEEPAPGRTTGNLALSPDGAAFPTVSASYARESDDLAVLVDGQFGFTRYQANRWFATGSPNEVDWIQIDFERAQTVSQVDVFLWGDAPRYVGGTDSSVTAPKALRVEVRQADGWAEVENPDMLPPRPLSMARNSIPFDAVEASAVRVYLTHNLPGVSGVTEIQIW